VDSFALLKVIIREIDIDKRVEAKVLFGKESYHRFPDLMP
jgi:hypothetical protein